MDEEISQRFPTDFAGIWVGQFGFNQPSNRSVNL
jgi:hypothetical protein